MATYLQRDPLVWRERPLTYGVDRRNWPGAKGRPDIAIEVWDDEQRVQVPRIIVLDATWSSRLETHVEKFLYRETIRDFTRTEASGKPARAVIASWAVYPGDPNEVDYEDDYRTGRLPIEPGPDCEATLLTYLQRLLEVAEGY